MVHRGGTNIPVQPHSSGFFADLRANHRRHSRSRAHRFCFRYSCIDAVAEDGYDRAPVSNSRSLRPRTRRNDKVSADPATVVTS
jgi:hypothetical protein